MSTLGTTNYELSEVLSDDYVAKQGLAGAEGFFEDMSPSNPQARRSGRLKRCVLMKNNSGGAITKNRGLKRHATNPLYTVAGVATGSDKCCGVGNDRLTGTVPDGSWFWVVVEGPNLVTSSAAITQFATVTTTTGGKSVATTSPPKDFDIGVALEAASAADEDKLVDLRCIGK